MTDPDGAWRWGAEASQLVSRRLVQLYQELQTSGRDGTGPGVDEELRRLRIDLERWVDLSVELFDRSSTLLRRLVEDGSDGRPSAEVVVVNGVPGAGCTADLWIHNVSEGERSAPTLRCAGLASAGGDVIESSHVRFHVDSGGLPRGSSRRVSVVVAVPQVSPPGLYHGLILADASPDSAISLRVRVEPSAAGGNGA